MNTSITRHLKVGGLVTYYVASIVGVGILIMPGIAARIAGPASLLAWVALVLISYPFASVFAYISMEFPDSSGITKAVEYGFGVALGRTMTILLACTMIIGNPVMGISTARYIQHITGIQNGPEPLVIGNTMMIFSVLFNLAGIQVGSRITSALLIILILGIVVMVTANIPFINIHHFQPFAPNGIAAIGTAALVCFFCFLGWENVSTIAEEIIEPKKTFRRAIPIAVVIVGVLYFSLAFMYISASSVSVITGTETVVSVLLRPAFGDRSATFGDCSAIVLLVLATNVWIAGASRLVWALARDGVLPPVLSKRSSRTSTPVNALVFLALGYSCITALLLMTKNDERALVTLTSANFLLVYLFVFVAAIRSFHNRFIRVNAAIALIATLAFLPFCGISLFYALITLAASYGLYRYSSSSVRKEIKNVCS